VRELRRLKRCYLLCKSIISIDTLLICFSTTEHHLLGRLSSSAYSDVVIEQHGDCVRWCHPLRIMELLGHNDPRIHQNLNCLL